jgi:hypothetical protein
MHKCSALYYACGGRKQKKNCWWWVLQSQPRINPLLLIKVALVGDSRNYPCEDASIPLVQLTNDADSTAGRLQYHPW